MSPAARYRGLGDLPRRIPVFPLQGAILLPRASMPLNIFEPRYLALIEDALRGERLVGMVQPADAKAPPSPEGSDVALRRTGCVGRITAFQETDDGRTLISLLGLCRFDITGERREAKPYRVCEVDFAPHAGDLEAGRGEDEVDREHLLAVLQTYLEANSLKADWKAIQRSSTEYLVNTLSMICPYGPEEKQALLEAPGLARRAEVLVALAEMEMAAGTGGTGSLQ